MRLWMALVVLLMASPVYAQNMGTTSGAMSMVNMSDPATTTSRVYSAPGPSSTIVLPKVKPPGTPCPPVIAVVSLPAESYYEQPGRRVRENGVD